MITLPISNVFPEISIHWFLLNKDFHVPTWFNQFKSAVYQWFYPPILADAPPTALFMTEAIP